MPLPKYDIEPVNISQCPLPTQLDNRLKEPNELECLSNLTLANVIRQIRSLSLQAGRIFNDLTQESIKIQHRCILANQRVNKLVEKKENLDFRIEEVNLHADRQRQLKNYFRSSIKLDQNVVSRSTMPEAIRIMYENADPPPELHRFKENCTDGKDPMELYTNPSFFFNVWCNDLITDNNNNKSKSKKKSLSNMQKKSAVVPASEPSDSTNGLIKIVFNKPHMPPPPIPASNCNYPPNHLDHHNNHHNHQKPEHFNFQQHQTETNSNDFPPPPPSQPTLSNHAFVQQQTIFNSYFESSTSSSYSSKPQAIAEQQSNHANQIPDLPLPPDFLIAESTTVVSSKYRVITDEVTDEATASRPSSPPPALPLPVSTLLEVNNSSSSSSAISSACESNRDQLWNDINKRRYNLKPVKIEKLVEKSDVTGVIDWIRKHREAVGDSSSEESNSDFEDF